MEKATTAQTVVTPELVEKLAAKYDDPLQAVIRPEVVMGVSRYFVERWVPVLGPSQATLVNTLRQLAYHHPTEPVTLSGEQLAKEASMSRRHLYKCLQSPWVGVFVRVQSGKKIKREGRTTRPPNRYSVRPEDPLTAADAQHLFDHLRELSENPLQAMRQALEELPRRLWAASPLPPAKTRFGKPKPLFVEEVARRAFPRWQPADEEESILFKVLAELLHKHITLVRDDGRVSKVIVPQYFRQRWWPLLGHDLAWIYLWLRAHTYDNPAEDVHRQSCWVASLNTLLEVIGRPREWWRRNVDRARRHPEGWLLSEFFLQTETKKGRNPNYPQRVARCFTVHLEIPVAPENRPYYTDLKLYWPEPERKEEERAPVLQRQPSAPPTPAQQQPVVAMTPLHFSLSADQMPALPLALMLTSAPDEPLPYVPLKHTPLDYAEPALSALPAEPDDPEPPESPLPSPPKPTIEERIEAALEAYRKREGQAKSDKTPHTPSYEDTKSHMRAQSQNGEPHTYTISDNITATSVHNSTPPSDTNVHKALPHSRTGSKHLDKALQEESHLFQCSSYPPPSPAGVGEDADAGSALKNKNIDLKKMSLVEALEFAYYGDLEKPFYQAAPLQTWLVEGPRKPIEPNTPAWKNAFSGLISQRDMVALILAVWADSTVFSHPRHLSWLTEKLILTGYAPVPNWRQFQILSDMSLRDWPRKGRRMWRELTAKRPKHMPWRLRDIFREAARAGLIPYPVSPYADTGLEEYYGGMRYNANRKPPPKVDETGADETKEETENSTDSPNAPDSS